MGQRVPPHFVGRIRVLPKLPDALTGLQDLASNIYWSWNPHIRSLFRNLDPGTWALAGGSPTAFMRLVKQSVLDRAAKDQKIRKTYDAVMKQYSDYMSGKKSWWQQNHAKSHPNTLVAYFSAEFGLHETLPIYSGGLGVLAGDHCKSASDLGVPFVAIGILYRDGYFIQRIDQDGGQRAEYKRLDWDDLPISPALDRKGGETVIDVDILGRKVYAKVWQVQVGRNSLYLLDTDIPQNTPEDRPVTGRLYGGDHEMRVQQEIILGIGGIRALRALGLKPTVFHMNEGHSVFLSLERLRELTQGEGLDFNSALEFVRSTSVFTTHTPVPAGNDAFPFPLIERYFRPYWEAIGLSRDEFLLLGREKREDGSLLFSLTVLALRCAALVNGVSQLHGEVSRALWQSVWPDVPATENPIGAITNGVHTGTWMSIDMQDLFDKHLPKDWRERITDPAMWENVDKIPDDELWATISKLKSDLIGFIHKRTREQHARFGESPDQLKELEKVFSDEALTIGFARRFATYKRATLILRDQERLKRLLNDPARPMQIVFSGKAHPADVPGQQFIREIQRLSRQPGFLNKIIFIEGYDMNVGRRLTSGVDIWLNNPRRPLEASGTSGMKVPLNGGLNCSILDGWWCEAYARDENAGFAIGEVRHYDNLDQQDEADAESIYDLLENVIGPLYYERDRNGIPKNWLKRVRASMKTCGPHFSTNRMVADYAEKYYLAADGHSAAFAKDSFSRARSVAAWKATVRQAWPAVTVVAGVEGGFSATHSLRVNEPIALVAEVDLGKLSPDDVSVEIFVQALDPPDGTLPEVRSIPMRHESQNKAGVHIYRGQLKEPDSGDFGYTVRCVPRNPNLVHPMEVGVVRWVGSRT